MPPGGAALPNNCLKSASTQQRTSQSIFIIMICHKQYHDPSPRPPESITALCPTCHTFPLCYSATWRALNMAGNRKKKPNAAPVIRGLWFKSRVQKQTSKEGKSTTAASIAPQKASSNEDMNS